MAQTAVAGTPKVELRSVGLRYFSAEGETEALSNVSLSVASGEFVAVIGPSGCGKSTLLSLISGIVAPTEGAVLIDGRPVSGPSRKIGYMLQQDYLFEWRTILENTVLGAEIQGAPMAKARERATQLLIRYGLGQFVNYLPRQLSGGMRQRVALARTLCTEPDVVLLVYEDGADEIVFYDITASSDRRNIMIDVVRRVAREIFIPFSVGGGIRVLDDIREVLMAGAEKVSVNTAAVQNPGIIAQGARAFGSQCIVLGMDVKKVEPSPQIPSGYEMVIHGGRTAMGIDALWWAQGRGAPGGRGDLP